MGSWTTPSLDVDLQINVKSNDTVSYEKNGRRVQTFNEIRTRKILLL